MTDNHYTPEVLAMDLVGLSKQAQPNVIADFSSGPGSLLYAAKQSWPNAQLHGLDLDPIALAAAKKTIAGITTYEVDYLSALALQLTDSLRGKVDLVLLNPPFTCRGSTFEETVFDGQTLKCSKAMAFILRSCGFLRRHGEMLAIVPRSCLLSEKDSQARLILNKKYVLEDMGKYESPGFSKASVSVHLIRVTKKNPIQLVGKEIPVVVERIKPKRTSKLFIMRGTHPVGKGLVGKKGPSLIHTTDLFNSEISISRTRAVKLNRVVSGTVLMLPRVSRPSLEKIAVGSFVNPIVPSDCIICVKTEPAGREPSVMEQFQRYWELLADAYSGTCASYLTLSSFQAFVEKLGFEAEVTDDPRIWNPNDNKNEESARPRSQNGR